MRRPGTLLVPALLVPAGVLVLALAVALTAGAGWGLGILATGWGALIVHHAIHVDRLARWAEAPLEANVPEGAGVWRHAFSALYQRARSRRVHERDLTHTIERFQSAAEAIPDGMVVLDSHQRIKWANLRAQSLLGLDAHQDIGAPLVNLVRAPVFVRYLEAGDYRDTMLMPSQRDADVTLAIQIVPFGLAEKLLIARDVTQMETVARMRRDFIANVSHELKTPLTVISGFIETLQDVDLDARQQARFLDLMREQSASMQRLVEDLLTLSALESEQNVLVDEPMAVAPLMEAIAADARGLSQGRHAIRVEIARDATILGGRDELRSALGNLVSNAIRYTPAGGSIALRFRIDPDRSGVFAVSDTGIGILAEHIPRLTERFYRVDRSRSRATGGTGLGLAIVKHVLLRHQGDLEIDSDPGKGSTFSVRLPARRVRIAAAPHDGAAPTAVVATADTDPRIP